MILAALAAMLAPAAMAQTVDEIAERAYDLLVAKNYDAAFPLMKQAAEKGDCESMGNLGTMYYKGLGTEIDYNQALRWWGEAEKKGCGDAIKAYRDELMATKSFEVDGIRYIVKADFTLMVTENKNYRGMKSVQIPENVVYKDKTYIVTSIGHEAFYNCRGLTSVTIPNSVTTIGDEAFMYCEGLTSVTIPNSVSSIGDGAFEGCDVLTSVTIPNSVTSIGNMAFTGCGGLTSVTIPNSVTSIGDRAFYLCSGLTSVTIPNSVTSIGNMAFSGCRELTSVTIPNSVTTIGERAFRYCVGLTSVTIPNSVTTICREAFDGCRGLTSVTIPNSVTTIGDSAFNLCSHLTLVAIPGSVTSIGDRAFEGCGGLIRIYSKISDVRQVKYGGEVFNGVRASCVLHVPRGTADAYRNTAPWNQFTNIVEE